jgi:hypothetical protein
MSDWTAETIARFRVLWDEGHSLNVIGMQLMVSRSAVAGKRRRLGFPERPSPINLGGKRQRSSVPRPHHKPTLPALASLATVAPIVLAPRKSKPPETVPTPTTPAPHVVSSGACAWPMWGNNERVPRDESKRFCCAPVTCRRNPDGSVHWSPYCEQHHSRAYHRIRDLRDEAA